MSLRLRAVLIAGVALALLWTLAAAWMLRDVHGRLDRTLDQRLAQSARMVSGLLQRSVLTPGHADVLTGPITVGGGHGIACQIRNLRGEIVASTSGAPPTAFDATETPGFANRRVDGDLWRTYTLRFDDYHITTADRVDERNALVRDILLAAGVPFLIALLGGLLALWIGIARGLAPLDSLRRTLQARDADSITPIDDAGAPSELQPVLAALNGLLARLAESLRQQRAFTDAAAHELRTPLTVVDTHLQVARLSTEPPVSDSLRSAEEGVRRLRRTLDQLMTLARAEVPGSGGDACDSALGVVDDVLGQLTPDQHARINVQVSGADAAVSMPHSMLSTALRNLVDNALRYAGQASRVDLNLRSDRATRRMFIEVADRGPGMGEEERAKAGQRFWRGDRGRGGHEGAGLGLSIVHAIVVRHGGAVRLRPREGGGLSVVLELPTMRRP